MDNLEKVKLLCKAYDVWPSRQKGQNFLINSKIIDQIITAANLSTTDKVLEVGPGLGILTEALIDKAGQVISVELDDKLFKLLKAKFVGVKNLQLVNNDILKIDFKNFGLAPSNYKIVANLPYNITSHFLKIFLTNQNRPKEMTLLLQKEVAERICADTTNMSLLSVSVQLYGKPEIINIVSRQNFWPKPEVDSAILKISNIKDVLAVDKFLSGISEKFFWQIVKIGFSSRRKQLQKNLAAGLRLKPDEVKKMLIQANFDEKIRAQNLSVADWLKLAKLLDSYFNK
ncbi:MAG: 16S rRNA (adenine(1518)-N(6)/adenine(1519)-N(6))-dimethyltransferase RsmA [Candidatus Buchananbacteria bacterium]